MITEYQWQVLNRDDKMTSIFVVDLDGIKLSDFVGETKAFVQKASTIAALHYPERAGKVFVVNVPIWFQVIWKCIKPLIDDTTMEKIYILRGKDEILTNLKKHVPIENIPPEYGGHGILPLNESPQEKYLAQLMEHNLQLEKLNRTVCHGCSSTSNTKDWPCQFCSWEPARRY